MISVITPVLNGERFIEACIQVVIDQACPDAEHIVVDGGSQDRTVEIIQWHALKYPHIRWISEPDRGQSDALNKGIGLARGSILSILNVDDYYEPDVLNRISEIFTSLPEPSLLVGNCNVWDDRGDLWYVNKPSHLKLTDLLLGWDVHPHPVNPSAYFYHASLHNKIGRYKEDMQVGQDLPFLLSAVQVATVKYVDDVWGNYRMIEGTLTFNAWKSGEGEERKERIVEAYLKELCLTQRLEFVVKREYHNVRRGIGNVLRKMIEK